MNRMAEKRMAEDHGNGRKRNYGIDLLRLISMLYVIILHTLGHGGILSQVKEGSAQCQAAWFLEIWAYGAVDIFALISGYVANTKKEYQDILKSYINLWLEVVFYSLLIVLLLKLRFPHAVSKKDAVEALFPLTNNQYWYFTALSGVYLVMPALLLIIRTANEVSLKRAFFVAVAMFSVYDIAAKRLVPGYGYSFVWLAILFFLGAVIKKCEIGSKIKSIYLTFGMIILIFATWFWKMYGFSFQIMEISIDNSLLVSYVSPTILGTAIIYLILCSRIQIGERAGRMISILSAGAFSAYLINDNRLFRVQFITDRFSFLAEKHAACLVGAVVLFSLIFLLASVAADRIRLLLFKALGLNWIAEMLPQKIAAAINKLS